MMKIAGRCMGLLTAAILVAASGQARANRAPVNGTLSPSRGVLAVAKTVSIVSTYSDADGAGNLATVYLLLNTTTSGANGIYLAYSSRENRLYLRNDANTAWLGGAAPGQSATIENSRVRLRCQSTTVSASGNNLTVSWSIEPQATVAAATLKAYIKCFDRAGAAANWTQKGTFSFGHLPVAESLSPATGNLTPGVKQTLTARFSDLDGTATLANTYVLINTSLTTAQGIYLAYNPVQNRLYLRNDAGDGWLGGVAPGSTVTISNSSVRVYCAETSVTSGPSGMTVSWRVEPLNGLAGKSCKAYLRAADSSGLTGDWEEKAALTISRRPVNDSVSPASAEFAVGSRQTVTAVFKDGDGAATLSTVYVLVNTSQNGANAGYVSYQLPQNKLWLRNDANSAWLGGFAPGSSNVIENAQFRLYCSESSVSVSGNALTLRLRLEAKSAMGGRSCGVWLKCFDQQGLVADWAGKGTFAYFAPPASNTIAVFPSRLVLKRGGSAAIVRAAVIGADGRVVSDPGTVNWTLSDPSLATIQPLGMDGLGEYALARVVPSGTSTGITTVQVSAGNRSAQATLTVAGLDGFQQIDAEESPAAGYTISAGESRLFFFQTAPDVTYFVDTEVEAGDITVELFDNPSLSGSPIRTANGEVAWDIPASRGTGTWFVRVRGLVPGTRFGIRLGADPAVYTTEDSPSIPLWHRMNPGGPGSVGTIGRGDSLYLYFDAEAGRTYFVEAGGPATLTLARDAAFSSIIASSQGELKRQIVPTASRRYYLRISGGEGGGFVGARVTLPYEGYVSQPTLQLYPRTLLMETEEGRGGDLALKAYLTGGGVVLQPPASALWSSSLGPGLNIQDTGLSTDGRSRTASVQIWEPRNGWIQVAAGGRKARTAHFGFLSVARGLGADVSPLEAGEEAVGSVAAGGERYYYLQTVPGAVYRFTTQRVAGDCDVYIEKWRPPIYENEDEPIPPEFVAQCPWAVGTVVIRVENSSQVQPCSFRLRVERVDDDVQPFVPYTMTMVEPGAPPVPGRVGFHAASIPYEEEALLYFDIPDSGPVYFFEIECLSGEIRVLVDEETTFSEPLADWTLSEGGSRTVEIPAAAGKRYFVRILGQYAVNYFTYRLAGGI